MPAKQDYPRFLRRSVRGLWASRKRLVLGFFVRPMSPNRDPVLSRCSLVWGGRSSGREAVRRAGTTRPGPLPGVASNGCIWCLAELTSLPFCRPGPSCPMHTDAPILRPMATHDAEHVFPYAILR